MTTKRKTQGGEKDKGRRASAEDCADTARALHALSSLGGFNFINNMLGDTIAGVSAGLGIERPAKWGDPRERPTVEDFARWLDQIPPTFDLDAPSQDLAGLISAVLKHPDTPRDLYDGMRRAIATLTEPDDVNEHPAVIRVALAVHKAEQEDGEEKGGAS